MKNVALYCDAALNSYDGMKNFCRNEIADIYAIQDHTMDDVINVEWTFEVFVGNDLQWSITRKKATVVMQIYLSDKRDKCKIKIL